MILGISGSIASGKTFVSRTILTTVPLFYTSFSDVLKKYCYAREIEPTRDVLQNLGKRLIDTKGADGFIEWMINQSCLPVDHLLLDGFRHVSIWDAFQKRFPTAQLIFCDVSLENQIDRIRKRDGLSRSQALTILTHPVEQDVCRLKTKASVIFDEKSNEEDIVKWVTSPVCIHRSIPPFKSHGREYGSP